MTKRDHSAGVAEALKSRHVFLDTQVFRQLRYSPENRAFVSLKKLISDYRIVLHVSDLTMMEVKRQIYESVTATQREIKALNGNLARWQKASKKVSPPPTIDFDTSQLADEVFNHLLLFVMNDCNAIMHNALLIEPAKIFTKYFDRVAPFDRENSKEFPDAFVLESLEAWCAGQNDFMYVVTADQAFSRACNNRKKLISLGNIHDVLAKGAADLGEGGENAAEEALSLPNFDASLEKMLDKQLDDLVFIYVGDLAEGEVYDPQLLSIQEINHWSVIALSEDYVTEILNIRLEVAIDVQYENRDEAIYDREDDVYFGAKPAVRQINEEIEVEYLVEINREDGSARNGELLTTEVSIKGPFDYD